MFGLSIYSQNDSTAGHKYVLRGKIVKKVQLTPSCGSIAWGTVIEFKVISIIGLIYKNENIGIVVTCPADMYGDNFFKKDQLYQVTFSDKNQANFGWTILNASLLKNNQLAFIPYAISINKLE